MHTDRQRLLRSPAVVPARARRSGLILTAVMLAVAAADVGCSTPGDATARITPEDERTAGERALRRMFPGLEGPVTRESIEAQVVRQRAPSEPMAGVAALASEAIQSGDLDRARDLLGELLAGEHVEAARSLAESGDLRGALAELDRAKEMAPHSASILCQRAEIALELSAPGHAAGHAPGHQTERDDALAESALADFVEAARVDPDGYAPRASLGASRASMALRRVEPANEYARRGIAALPRSEAATVRGAVDAEIYDLPLRRALAETSFDLYLGAKTAGTADALRTRAAESHDALVDVLGRAPEETWTWDLLARLAQSEGAPAEARELAGRGLAFAPDDTRLLDRLAQSARDVGGPQAAVLALARFCRAHPDSEIALRELARAQFDVGVEDARAARDPRAPLAAAEASLVKAAALASSRAESGPDSGSRALAAQSQGVLGFWLLGRGELEEAQKAFLEMEALDPGSLAADVQSTRRAASEGLFEVAQAFGKRGAANERRAAAELERAAAACDYLHEALPDDARFAAGAGQYNRDAAVALELEARGIERSKPADAKLALARARELMERSWRAFDDAARLAADDEMVLAQAGAVLARYLQRDGERARELLERAVEIGEQKVARQRKLVDQPGLGSADRDERLALLEEQQTLVGDACRDLGALYLTLLGDPARAAQWLERSLRAGPDPPPGADALLARSRDAIGGKIDPRLRDEDRWAAPLEAGRTP